MATKWTSLTSRSHAATCVPHRVMSLLCLAVSPAAHYWTPCKDHESAFNHCHDAIQLSNMSVALSFLQIRPLQASMACFLLFSYFDRPPFSLTIPKLLAMLDPTLIWLLIPVITFIVVWSKYCLNVSSHLLPWWHFYIVLIILLLEHCSAFLLLFSQDKLN